jgi:hypothetical protein
MTLQRTPFDSSEVGGMWVSPPEDQTSRRPVHKWRPTSSLRLSKHAVLLGVSASFLEIVCRCAGDAVGGFPHVLLGMCFSLAPMAVRGCARYVHSTLAICRRRPLLDKSCNPTGTFEFSEPIRDPRCVRCEQNVEGRLCGTECNVISSIGGE